MRWSDQNNDFSHHLRFSSPPREPPHRSPPRNHTEPIASIKLAPTPSRLLEPHTSSNTQIPHSLPPIEPQPAPHSFNQACTHTLAPSPEPPFNPTFTEPNTKLTTPSSPTFQTVLKSSTQATPNEPSVTSTPHNTTTPLLLSLCHLQLNHLDPSFHHCQPNQKTETMQ
ncbi:hypothetical protein V6N12_026647 [Hibiscus sabdariffa]|uniref:Extensin-like n=1 Tax=Hibiscus sabdariffa TaxID=183260 RepID=A0ABR2DSC4_9ROSI